MADEVLKLIVTLAFPLIAFLSLIVWLAVVLQKDRGLSVNLRLLGLSLSVAARPLAKERRGIIVRKGEVDAKETEREGS